MKYGTILADPPWEYDDGFPTQSRSAGKWEGPVRVHPLPYPAMSIAEISALPVEQLADRSARLFLWATNRYLPSAFGIIESWGFVYRQTLTWEKPDALNGHLAPNAEFLVIGVRGNPGRTGRLQRAVFRFAQAKRHSQKPVYVQEVIERVSRGPYLELFSRRQRPGWEHWGHGAITLDGDVEAVLGAAG